MSSNNNAFKTSISELVLTLTKEVSPAVSTDDTLMTPALLACLQDLHAHYQSGSYAFLEIGAYGVGKSLVARVFSNDILCHQPSSKGKACGCCSSCLLFSDGTHPDYHQLSQQDLRVDKIRELIEAAYRRPHQGGKQVVVIESCHHLTQASANALLKVLEEPPSGLVWLLLTANPGQVLATIRSRCQSIVIKTTSLSANMVWLKHQALKSNMTLTSAELIFYMIMAYRAPYQALKLAKEGKEGFYPYFMAFLFSSMREKEPINIVKTSEVLLKKCSDLPQIIDAFILFILSCLQSKQSDFDLIQNIFLGVFHDHSSYFADVLKAIQSLHLHKFYHFYDKLLQLKKRYMLQPNLNKSLQLQSLLLLWGDVIFQNHRSEVYVN